MENARETLKANIRKYKSLSGLTNKEIAHKLNVSMPTVNDMLNKPDSYAICKLNRLANVLGCSVNHFFIG